MKIFIFAIYLSILNLFTNKSNLIIQINGIEEIKGKIQIGIYNDEDKFPDVGGEYRIEYIKVNSSEAVYTIKNLPLGDYAIALFHDINSDGVCNFNFWGIPTESYGFSNNIKPLLSAPSFEDTKISVYKDTKIIINLLN